MSVQRIQNVAPFAMPSDGIVDDSAVRLPAALPSFAPAVAVFGVTKFSAVTAVHVPVVRFVASVLYSKLSWSVRVIVPRRHCSPVKARARLEIVAPVLFVKHAPKFGISVPLRRPASARSVEPAAP